MCTLFANLYVLLTWGPHMVYMGTPYIFDIYMIRCGWLGILMRHLAAEPRNTVGPLLTSKCPCGTILLTLYLMVWDGGFQEQGQYFFIDLTCLVPVLSSTVFPFFFFLSICWYCGPGVLRLIGYKSLEVKLIRLIKNRNLHRTVNPSLALLTSFNKNINHKYPPHVRITYESRIKKTCGNCITVPSI